MCNRFIHFMNAQKEIIEHHIDEHAWCQHIEDKQQAKIDFIEKFGWAFREIYCRCCPEYKKDGVLCDIYIESMR